MGAGGVTLDGFTNSHGLLIDIQRAMMKSAGSVIFCLDHTKFGRKSVAFLCGIERKPTIVTDNGSSIELVTELRNRGLPVLIANPDGTVDGNGTPQSESGASQGTQEGGEKSSADASQLVEAGAGSTVSLVGWD